MVKPPNQPVDHTDAPRPRPRHQGPGDGWSFWVSHPGLRAVLLLVFGAGVVTVLGLVLLWPTGEGREAATASAAEIGLATQLLGGTVQEVRDRPCSYSTEDNPLNCRQVMVLLDEGPSPGSVVTLPEFDLSFTATTPQLSVGQRVVIGYEPATDFYFYSDTDRRGPLAWLSVLFAGFVIALGRLRGGLALLGMAVTLAVLIIFMAPSVLDGNEPVLVAVVAASTIAFVNLYLTHGLNPITTVALAGTLSSLGLTLGLSWAFFELSRFTGLATEEALILPIISGGLDVGALILGGAVIGTLGALDDVTVTQAALVSELQYRNPGLRVRELVSSGIRVGREHIASTVNTLLLAYAGASIPLVMLFAVSNQSLVTVANSELIAVEIVRTLCGSMGLVAAVPITTTLAALVTAGASDPRRGDNTPLRGTS